MNLLKELLTRFIAPAEDLFWNPDKRIEASVGLPPAEDGFGNQWHVRPAETIWDFPVGEAMKTFDAASLHVQRIAQANFALTLPDVRFRVITTGVDQDGYAGTHFGTLMGAKELAQKRFDKAMGIIDGSARSVTFPQLPSPK